MTFRARLIATAVAASLGALAFAGSASASFHEIQVREVYLGDLGNDSFIELQMFSAGQTQVAGQTVTLYAADGSVQGVSPSFAGNVTNGQSQRTILIGDTAVTNRDFAWDMMYETAGGGILAAGGAACFSGNNDCVTWGNFVDSSVNYTGTAGTPLLPAGIPAGSSITRKLTRGCRTALDRKDDTNNSATDFARTGNPSPRGNAGAITERPCSPCGGKPGTLTGTNGKDVLVGTPGNDVIAGLGGRDTIKGKGGRDILCGGKGRDKLIGGKGRDVLRGGPGRDTQIQ
jgi:Ca2+-binding RTX toxin-like protein